MEKIPLSKPYIDEKEIEIVTEVLKSGFLALGPKLGEFEQKFAKRIGTKYAIAVNSGTSGLHLCMKAIDLKEGDEVITSPFSFVASSNPALFEKAKPIFVDVKEDTYNIDPDKIEEAITDKTKAILPVHIFGQPCDMDKIMKIAAKHNLAVIEDACESIDAEYKGKKVGTFGLASVFAFYPNKQMTTGEGGIIVTDSEKVYKLCRSLRNQGRSEIEEWLAHERLGYNYRLDEMSCAIGITQLDKLDYMIKKRQEIAEKYTQKLSKINGIITPYVGPNVKHTWFLYTIRVREGINRDKFMQYLNDNGVASKPYFPSIHLQPFYKKMFNFKEGDFPIAEKISNSILALPIYVQMSDKEIDSVVNMAGKGIKS